MTALESDIFRTECSGCGLQMSAPLALSTTRYVFETAFRKGIFTRIFPELQSFRNELLHNHNLTFLITYVWCSVGVSYGNLNNIRNLSVGGCANFVRRKTIIFHLVFKLIQAAFCISCTVHNMHSKECTVKCPKCSEYIVQWSCVPGFLCPP